MQTLIERIKLLRDNTNITDAWVAYDTCMNIIKAYLSDPEALGRLSTAIENELNVREMVLADPLTLQRLQASRIAKKVISAIIGEHMGTDSSDSRAPTARATDRVASDCSLPSEGSQECNSPSVPANTTEGER